MAINQLNKYVWLVETIHKAKKRGGITLKEIQSRWLDSDLSEGTELSRRTFINNIHSIEELFEINDRMWQRIPLQHRVWRLFR